MAGQPNRRPAGIPTGGQFAPKASAEASFELTEPEASPTAPVFGHLSDLDRDERVAALRSEIDRAMGSLSSADGWRDFLEARAKFHTYSINNAHLILWQRPDAKHVAGFNDWKNKFGRTVNKGERAIWVLAPIVRKADRDDPESESRVVGFRTVGVFDVSQTSGPPLPEAPVIPEGQLADYVPPAMVEDMNRVIESHGFRVQYGPTGDAGGWTDFRGKKVVISNEATPAATARTLAHEAAHIALGHGDRMAEYHTGAHGRRPDMEVEAESVAYVIGRYYGMETVGAKSFSYIDGWAAGDTERVKATATRVIAGVKAILDHAQANGDGKEAA